MNVPSEVLDILRLWALIKTANITFQKPDIIKDAVNYGI